jgi:hypothetical protein
MSGDVDFHSGNSIVVSQSGGVVGHGGKVESYQCIVAGLNLT